MRRKAPSTPSAGPGCCWRLRDGERSPGGAAPRPARDRRRRRRLQRDGGSGRVLHPRLRAGRRARRDHGGPGGDAADAGGGGLPAGVARGGALAGVAAALGGAVRERPGGELRAAGDRRARRPTLAPAALLRGRPLLGLRHGDGSRLEHLDGADRPAADPVALLRGAGALVAGGGARRTDRGGRVAPGRGRLGTPPADLRRALRHGAARARRLLALPREPERARRRGRRIRCGSRRALSGRPSGIRPTAGCCCT